MNAVTYRLEIVLERSREGVLPKIDLVGEFGLCDVESFGGNMNVLEAKLVREVDEG